MTQSTQLQTYDVAPISDLTHRIINHRNVIINLLPSKARLRDVMFTTDRLCPHLTIKEHQCQSCGAFVGFIGQEDSSLQFYKHLTLLANSFINSDNVYIITDRYMPDDYQLPTVGMTLMKHKGFKYQATYILYNKVARSKNAGFVKQTFITHFTSSKDFIWKSKVILAPKIDLLSLISHNDCLFVNPSLDFLKFYSNDFKFIISDSSVAEALMQQKDIK